METKKKCHAQSLQSTPLQVRLRSEYKLQSLLGDGLFLREKVIPIIESYAGTKRELGLTGYLISKSFVVV
jgi:hypothetical protein